MPEGSCQGRAPRGWSGGAALLGAGLMESQALAAYFGRVILKPGETQQLHIGGAARNLRECNDFSAPGRPW